MTARRGERRTHAHGGVAEGEERPVDARTNLATGRHYPVRGGDDVRMGCEGLGGVYCGIVFLRRIVGHVEGGEVEHVERHVRVEGRARACRIDKAFISRVDPAVLTSLAPWVDYVERQGPPPTPLSPLTYLLSEAGIEVGDVLLPCISLP